MNHKIIEDWIGYIAGVFGFGVFWTNVHWNDFIWKMFIGAASAFIAGYIGYLGKVVGVWSIHKGKSFIQKIKSKK